MKIENNGKTLSGSVDEMKAEFYRQVKADEFQNGYWQWKFYSNFFNQFESLPNKNHPVFDENTKYACEMTEEHPEYAKLSRKPVIAGETKFVSYQDSDNTWWLGIVVTIKGKYYLIDSKSLNYLTTSAYQHHQEILNAYECTPEEIQQIKDSLFNA